MMMMMTTSHAFAINRGSSSAKASAKHFISINSFLFRTTIVNIISILQMKTLMNDNLNNLPWLYY